jgi:hypothetical protein
MSKTPGLRGPAPATSPQPAVYKSLGLSALMRQLEGRTGFTVLDLGPACGTNVEFWSQFQSKLYVEDLFQGLRSLATAAPEEGAPSPFPELLPFSDDIRFDVILAWDIFNYLHQALLEQLVSHLTRFCRDGTYVFALVSVLPQMPAEPHLYRILDNERMIYDARSAQMKPCPRYQPRDIARLMSSFAVSSSFLLRHGVQEYVFVLEGK